MKKIYITSSPSTEYEIERVINPYALDGVVYFQPEAIEFKKTEEQTAARNAELEQQVAALQLKLDAILDIVYPDRYDEDDVRD